MAGCVTREGPPPLPPVDQGQDPDVRTIDEVGNDPVEAPLTPAGVEQVDDPIGGISQGNPVEPAEGYRTIGGVLGEVNGKAIYATDVIDARRNQLRALALRLPPTQFAQEAGRILMEEVSDRTRNAILLSIFERNASQGEQQLATLMTTAWRLQFITQHGGSEAEARRAAREQYGMSLEALGEDEYQRHLSRTFVRKNIMPHIRPTAVEVRQEYERLRKAGELDQAGEIDFSIIEFRPDADDEVSLAAMQNQAAEVRQRALAGESFDELARVFNDNPALASSGGRLPASLLPLAKGSYAVAAVDEAAWETQEGDVSPVIAHDGKLFLVKVNTKLMPRTLGFDEVQRNVLEQMAAQEQQRRLNVYQKAEIARLEQPTGDEQRQMLATALEIVMQEYDRWRDEATSSSTN